MLICRRCERGWKELDEQTVYCVSHGETTLPPLVDPDGEEFGGERWAADEKGFVLAHLEDMSYRRIAEELCAMGRMRTMRAVEHFVHGQGWNKKYVRGKRAAAPAPLPRGLTPAVRAVAVLLRVRACEGWSASMSQLADETGMDRSQARRCVQKLVKLGLVQVTVSGEGWGRRGPNTYRWVGTPRVPTGSRRVDG